MVTYSFTAVVIVSFLGKCCPCSPSFIGPNRWKSRQFSGWGRTVQPRLAMCSMVFKLVWAWCYHVSRERLSSSLVWLWNSSLQLSQHRDVAVRVDGLSGFKLIQKNHLFPVPKDRVLYLLRAELFLWWGFHINCHFESSMESLTAAVMENWWDGSASTAILPTSTSNVIGQHSRIRGITLRAVFIH